MRLAHLLRSGALAACAALVGGSLLAAPQPKDVTPTVSRLQNAAPLNLVASQGRTTNGALRASLVGDTCSAYMGGDPWWLISGWAIGQESYKAYQDPEQICPGAYPFTVQEAHMYLNFRNTGGILPYDLNVFIEILDLDPASTPECPLPGDPLFIGSPGTVTIPQAGFYDITIPMDFPYEVDGPYFISITFTDTIPSDLGMDLVTDPVEALCVSYNIWDTLVGDVDLGDDEAVRPQVYPPGWCCLDLPLQDSCFESNVNPPQTIPCFDFDGRVLLWTYGLMGGEPPDPFPGIAFLNPRDNDMLYETTDIWIAETAGSSIIDSAVFYYRGGGAWTRIGVDGDPTLSAGFFLPGPGDGLSYSWDFVALAEGDYWLRTDLHDTLGRVASDSIQIYLEPTPPVPTLRPPPMYFDRICGSVNMVYDYTDENPTFTVFQKKTADINYSKALETLGQFELGDADGDSADGNLAVNGEFGDFYGSAVAATLCMRYWHGLGYVSSMRIGSQDLTNIEAAERLAGFMLIKQDTAITDERTVLGLREYFQLTGFGQLSAGLQRNPSYADLRTQFEEVGAAAIIAVADKPGRWYAVDGFVGRPSTDGTFKVNVVDPWDGAAKTLYWRETGPVAEVFVNNAWKAVDLMVMIQPSDWQPTGRSGIGFDTPAGGSTEFVLSGAGAGLVDGNLYFITAELADVDAFTGRHTTLLDYTCTAFLAGDYNGDATANIGDLVYLIAYMNLGGPAPVGGAARADVNCDTMIDTSDLVYYISWLFGGGAAPCQ